MQRNSMRASKQLPEQITNNHEYLNFIKKNHRMIEFERNKLLQFPLPLEVNRNSSVFALKDGKREYRLDKLAFSLNTPSYQLQKGKEEHLSAQKVYEIVERKNREIEQSMSRERQSMSEIIYNYSKFRSMENQYYKNEKVKKRSIVKEEDLVKLPHVNKNHQDIFTIDYDPERKKMTKVNLVSADNNQEKKKSQSLINGPIFGKDAVFAKEVSAKDVSPAKEVSSGKEWSSGKEVLVGRESPTKDAPKQRELLKRSEFALMKQRKMESQFGIQIKAIQNHKITDNNIECEGGAKLKKQLYELSSNSPIKPKERLKQPKKQDDEQFQKQCKQQVQQKFVYSNSIQSGGQLNAVSTRQVFASNFFVKNKPKYSSSSLSNRHFEDYEEAANEVIIKQEQIQLQKDKLPEARERRQNIKKTVIVIHQKEVTVYDQKINTYRQFIFMVNMAHKKYDPISLRDPGSLKNQEKYKYYVGLGNNSLLVKSLMKRRFWWALEEDSKKANFAWTQLKINNFFQYERKSQVYDIDSKIQVNIEVVKKKKLQKKQLQGKVSLKSAVYKPPLPLDKDKILTSVDKKIYDYLQQSIMAGDHTDRLLRYSNKLRFFESSTFTALREDKSEERMHNHLQFNHFIGNKKALFYNLKQYYQLLKKNVFQIIPLTYHIKLGAVDPQFGIFIKQFKRLQTLKHHNRKKKQKDVECGKKIKNIWIIKPGQLSNRGNGIVVIKELYELASIFKKKQKHSDGNLKTYIVQKYIQNPLLYKGRKFDIRHYMIITRLHGIMRAYWYGEGYIRTSSYDFDLDDVGDEMIHLTNDAIQKNSTFYGKHEEGNKLSYSQFQKYLDQKFGQDKVSFSEHIYPKMKAIATDAVRSTYLQLDSRNMQHNFEVFGLDFMIDEDFNVWLIEVNTNPCLQLSSKLLGRIIPNMLQQALRLSLDVIFPPPTHYPNSQKYLAPDNSLGRLMYELIFDEARDGRELVDLFRNTTKIDYGDVREDEEVYENEGKQIQLVVDIN